MLGSWVKPKGKLVSKKYDSNSCVNLQLTKRTRLQQERLPAPLHRLVKRSGWTFESIHVHTMKKETIERKRPTQSQ